ncbi:MAG: hypothetical protein HC771_05860 [Synechococcales cyanobacterium CRU_2_2]|nr:hypothetical protein [Synechococcales cyanobacterium CRU_2_2]
MQQGKDLLEAGQLEAAIAKLKLLPAESPVDKERETTIKRWQADWTQSKNAIQNAEDFLERGQWLSAKQSLASVASIGFWQRKAKPLIAKADAGIALVEQYAAEQYQQPPAAALAAAPSAVYTPPAWDTPAEYSSPPEESWQPAPGAPPAPAPPQSPSYAAEYSAPPPVAAAQPPSTASFDQAVEGLYQSYKNQGQGTWDAWGQACADSGGQVIDQGPESACLP